LLKKVTTSEGESEANIGACLIGIKGLVGTLSINDTQHNSTSTTMLSVTKFHSCFQINLEDFEFIQKRCSDDEKDC